MAIITKAELASYLRDPDVNTNTDADLIVSLADGLVAEIVGAPTTVPTRVKAITLEVAARAWRNPKGYSSETIDDYTYRRDADTRRAGVYLTDGERAELQSFDVMSNAYSLDLGTPAT
jgi:hypothetical protein